MNLLRLDRTLGGKNCAYRRAAVLAFRDNVPNASSDLWGMKMKLESTPGFGALEVCKPTGEISFSVSKKLLDHPEVLRALLKIAEAGGAKAIMTVEQDGRYWVQVPE